MGTFKKKLGDILLLVSWREVIRRASLQHKVTDLDECSWSIELTIPFSVLGCHSCPETLEANLYKCGEKTKIPHFISWNPVGTPAPDFHRPEYFGTLILTA